jgi:hypothetical protein
VHKLASSKIEEELREQTELLRKFEARGVIFFVLGKACYKFD